MHPLLKFMLTGRQKSKKNENFEKSDFYEILKELFDGMDDKDEGLNSGFERLRETDDLNLFNSSIIYSLFIELIKAIPFMIEEAVAKNATKKANAGADAGAGDKKQAETDKKKLAPSKKAAKKASWKKRKEAKEAKAQNTNAPAPGKKA